MHITCIKQCFMYLDKLDSYSGGTIVPELLCHLLNQEFIIIIYMEGEYPTSVLPVQNTLRQVVASSPGYFSIISVNFGIWLRRERLVDRC